MHSHSLSKENVAFQKFILFYALIIHQTMQGLRESRNSFILCENLWKEVWYDIMITFAACRQLFASGWKDRMTCKISSYRYNGNALRISNTYAKSFFSLICNWMKKDKYFGCKSVLFVFLVFAFLIRIWQRKSENLKILMVSRNY